MVAMEALHQVRVLRSEDAREAISAFFEKRTPKFSGR
jgi:enoyl-CoA hydratase/carnithine racemase